MEEITNSIKELRKTLDSKIDSCITKDKAEKIIEDVIAKLHPAQSKALIPTTQADVFEKFAKFCAKGAAQPETPWTSEYGRKFGGMKNFLLAAKNRHSILNDFKTVISEGGAGNTGGGYLVPAEFSSEVIKIMNEASPIMQIANIATVKLLGRNCEIRPLSIKSAVRLGRIIGKMHARIKEAQGNFFAAVLENAGADETKEIINIFTAGALADIENIDDKLTVHDLSLLTKAVAEVNDFEAICANFTIALGKAARSQPIRIICLRF